MEIFVSKVRAASGRLLKISQQRPKVELKLFIPDHAGHTFVLSGKLMADAIRFYPPIEL